MLFQKRIDLLKKLIHLEAGPKLVRAAQKFSPAEVSVIFKKLSDREKKVFLGDLLSAPAFLESVLVQLPKEELSEILRTFDDALQVSLLTILPPDRGWTFIQNLDEEKQHELLEKLPQGKRDRLEAIAHYPEDVCGFHMQTPTFKVSKGMTADQVIQKVREKGEYEGIFYIYVIDEDNHLIGVLPLRSLLKESGETPIENLMITDPIIVQDLEPLSRAAKRVAQYNLLAIPVVTESHHLIGVITVDDVVDIIQKEATEDMFLMAGLGKDDRLATPILETIKKRTLWMVINLATAFLAASVVGFFRESIEKVVALAIFMPVVAGMGGNGGTQALTIITRSLALGEIGSKDLWWATGKQAVVGLAVGATTGLLTGLVAWGWQGSLYLGLVLWLAMMVNMLIAGLAGALVPNFLKLIKQDPALGSGVIVTTFTDVFGFLSFLGLATLFLKYLV